MVTLTAVIIARVVSVFIPIAVILLANGGTMQLRWNQVGLIMVGGIIRGAIAFALSL